MSPKPKTEEVLAAVGIARQRHAELTEHTPATRVLDSLGREWSEKSTGGWGAIGSTATADSFPEIEAKYGPVDVIA